LKPTNESASSPRSTIAARGYLQACTGELFVTLDVRQFSDRAASALNHPYICTIHDIDQDSGVPLIAMELLKGSTLKHRISGQPMPLGTIMRVYFL
jgi:hypothetical protein